MLLSSGFTDINPDNKVEPETSGGRFITEKTSSGQCRDSKLLTTCLFML